MMGRIGHQFGRSALFGTLIVLVMGCGLLPAMPGDVPVRIVAQVELQEWEGVSGTDLTWWSGGWTHTVEGSLSRTSGWKTDRSQIAGAQGRGQIHCYAGDPKDDFTTNWESPLSFERFNEPIIHIRIDGEDALILYAAPRDIHYIHPGQPACEADDPVPAGTVASTGFSMHILEAERAPNHESSTLVAEQDGVVILRMPLADLRAGTTLSRSVDFQGEYVWYYGEVENRLRITLELTSG